MVPMQIGNTTGWGFIDTGAQKTILSPGFARAIGLSGAAPKIDDTITGVDGRPTPLTAYTVSGATVGKWRFGRSELRTAALPLFDRIGGMEARVAVIGMDWIAARPFAIDYGKQRVWQR